MTQLRLHSPHVYRVTLSEDRFGQIRRDGRRWLAEIRDTATGVLVRFAGIWNTRRDALDELLSLAAAQPRRSH